MGGVNAAARVPVSVLIPTFNEQLNLPACLASVAGWADEIFVVDSLSTDGTVEIARSHGAHVVQHAFEGYAQQKNWALDTLPFAHEWVLILDADERMTPELADEIAQLVAAGGNGCDGFYLNRRFIFYGKWIRHCGWYPSWNLRLFRHRLGRYEDRAVHEHVILQGRAGRCRNDMIHEDRRDMSFWIAKHNEYSSKEACEWDRVRRGDATGLKLSLRNALGRKRFIKETIWPRLPGRGLLFFLYMYIFRLGFLDGRHGYVFCRMHALFQQFTTVKLWELEQSRNRQHQATCEPRSAETGRAGGKAA